MSWKALLALFAAACAAGAHAETPRAEYTVRVLSHEPPRLAVTASVPIDGQTLEMGASRPAGIAELDARGWPGLVANLRIVDDEGSPLPATAAGADGWRLARRHTGRLTLHYEVDYGPLAERDWPAQREAGFADPTHLVFIGRSLFITTPAAATHRVTFKLLRPWQAVTPWRQTSGDTFEAGDGDDLLDNLLVLTRSEPSVITSGGFRLLVVATGHWEPARAEIRRVLEAVVPQLVRIIGAAGQEIYLVVLLPARERGGESFRGSFAMTYNAPPSRANSADWGNTIAHEVFHFWNGWRMRGSDYAASQWFQEGFTEYAANLAMVTARLIDEETFRQKLSQHLRNYEKLATPLDAPGTRKGPPLYSGGALVAFAWDVMLRDATGGKRSIRDVYQMLWKSTEYGRLAYDWPRIEAALTATANLDWVEFHRRHIEGTESLRMPDVLRKAGLRIVARDDQPWRVEPDPDASPDARGLWQSLTRGSK